MYYICNGWHLIILFSSYLGSEGINSSHNCCFSSQTGEAAGSCVCSWTPGRLGCRCLVSRWVTVLRKNRSWIFSGHCYPTQRSLSHAGCFFFSSYLGLQLTIIDVIINYCVLIPSLEFYLNQKAGDKGCTSQIAQPAEDMWLWFSARWLGV